MWWHHLYFELSGSGACIELILALTDISGHWQPGCAEHFRREDIAGAQLVQIKVCSFLFSFIVSVSVSGAETLYPHFKTLRGRWLNCRWNVHLTFEFSIFCHPFSLGDSLFLYVFRVDFGLVLSLTVNLFWSQITGSWNRITEDALGRAVRKYDVTR